AVLALAVGAAIGGRQALDADALSVADVAATAGHAGRDRRVRRDARVANVLGAGVAVVGNVGRVEDELHVAAAVALRDLAVAGRLICERRSVGDVLHAAGLVGVAGAGLASGVLPGAVGGGQAADAVAGAVALVLAA